MTRAVLDSNVLVSALIQPSGKPARILAHAGGRFEWLTSEVILSEVADVLGRKHIQQKYRAQTTTERRERYLTLIRDLAEIIAVTTTLAAVRADPKDNPVLACAVDGQADYLVSGDRHLLALGAHQQIEILTADRFLSRLETFAAR